MEHFRLNYCFGFVPTLAREEEEEVARESDEHFENAQMWKQRRGTKAGPLGGAMALANCPPCQGPSPLLFLSFIFFVAEDVPRGGKRQ
jgi:hypothetical protein